MLWFEPHACKLLMPVNSSAMTILNGDQGRPKPRAFLNRLAALMFGLTVSACAGGGTPAKSAETVQPAPAQSTAPLPSTAPEAPEAARAEPGKPSSEPQVVAETAGGEPKVTLVSPGKDPKGELRYTPKVNQTDTLTMTIEMGVVMKLGGQSAPSVNLPKMASELVTRVTSIAPDGAISYDFEVKTAKALASKDVKPDVLKKIDSEFAKIAGIKGRAVVDARGITRDLQMDIPAGVDPSVEQVIGSLRQSMRHMSNPLPIEPVGIGAKWDAEQTFGSQGIQLKQLTHSTLLSHKGSKITLAIEFEQHADPQSLHLPTLPPGTQAKLAVMTGHGKGDLQSDLTRLAPVKSTAAVESHSEIEASQGAQSSRLVTDLLMKIDFKSR